MQDMMDKMLPLQPEEVERVLSDARRRIERVLVARGLIEIEHGRAVLGETLTESEYPLFAHLLSASADSRLAMGCIAGAPLPSIGTSSRSSLRDDRITPRAISADLAAEGEGFSLHAGTRIDAHDSDRLEHLCRYVSRPALAQGRLVYRDDGKVVWNLRRPWRNGTCAFVLDPLEFIAKLAALVPHPREHQLTYHGSLAPASPIRDLIVPRRPLRSTCGRDPQFTSSKFSWSELLERVFGEDILRCPRCGDRRRAIAVVTDPGSVRRLLAHLNLRTDPLELTPARPPPQPTFDF